MNQESKKVVTFGLYSGRHCRLLLQYICKLLDKSAEEYTYISVADRWEIMTETEHLKFTVLEEIKKIRRKKFKYDK